MRQNHSPLPSRIGSTLSYATRALASLLLALVVLAALALPAGAAAASFGPGPGPGAKPFAEPAPAITNPGPQESPVGTPLKLPIAGEHLHSLEAKPLPEGLALVETGAEAWAVEGTPTKPETVEVVLTGENEAKEPAEEQKFTWRIVEAAPTIEKPAPQHSVVGVPITPVIVKGTHLATLEVPVGKPAGLELVKKTETEWEIRGTPTTAEPEHEVVLAARNAENGPVATREFKWTVAGPPAELEPVPDQTTTAGTPVSLAVTGRHMAFVTATSLPEGLALEQVSESEWRIVGTPTTAKGAVLVTLEAKNSEKLGGAARVFRWTITAPVPTGPAPSGTLAVSPALVFSASRAECAGVSWPAGATASVATQWLLDGAPIPGASALTYVPPRSDDGHALACSQTATGTNGVATSVRSAARVVYEQPAQPSWPIIAANQRCRTAVCMIDGGAAAVQSAQSYPAEGSWQAARQVRCVSAPWTSEAGDSAVAGVHQLAVAHAVTVQLQRVSSSGVVTLISAQAGGLPEGAVPGPYAGSLAVPVGTLPFAAGELWTRLTPAAAGTPNWFAAGAGALFYSTGKSGVPRSFQLVYNLTAADLGTRLRCLAGAQVGPGHSPTGTSFASPEYTVSASSACAPRRLAEASSPQPALVEPGRAQCLLAPTGPGALEGGQAAIGVSKGRAIVYLACALGGGCRGKLSIVSGKVLAGRAQLALARRRGALVHVALTPRGRRLLSRSAGGVAVVVKLKTRRAELSLGSARLLNAG